MSDFDEQIQFIEKRAEDALGTLEQDHRWAEALAIYHSVGEEIDALAVPRADPIYKDARRARAYLYLREANALRALGRFVEAEALADLELDAAMASGHGLTIARAMFSLGASCLANGQIERGLKMLDDARPMFAHEADAEHQQGLGWWHIIQADISNAGMARTDPAYALEHAQQALDLLRPLENWPGVARAYEARAKAFEKQGRSAAAQMALAAAAGARRRK